MTMNIETFAVLFPLLLLLLGLAFTVLIDPYLRREQRRIMLIIVALSLSLIGQDLVDNTLFVQRSNLALKYLMSAYGYSVRPVILILFLYIIRPEGKKWHWWTLAGINALLYFTSPFTKLCFEIRESDFLFLRGPLGFTCFVVSGILLVELLIRTILRYRETRKLEQMIPASVALIIAVSVALDISVKTEQPIAFLNIAIVVGSVFYYIWLHLQFVREHEQDLMATQRIQIMMTQIQPHFLYNTLSTIQALCRTDPEKAFDVTEKFGAYLRRNLDSLNQTELIPIQKELEHTGVYAEIEAVRFPHIRIEYEIGDADFSVPALTVQPLVENAIRHGVRIRQNGLVTVATRKGAACHEIIISDNGKGFDPAALEQIGQAHIGIRNVRERIESMCGGSLTVDSRPDEGTTVTIRIPFSRSTASEKGD